MDDRMGSKPGPFLPVRRKSPEELRHALAEFRERYNPHWIIQRLGYLTPQQARKQLPAQGVVA